jgi:hypothetical protein
MEHLGHVSRWASSASPGPSKELFVESSDRSETAGLSNGSGIDGCLFRKCFRKMLNLAY